MRECKRLRGPRNVYFARGGVVFRKCDGAGGSQAALPEDAGKGGMLPRARLASEETREHVRRDLIAVATDSRGCGEFAREIFRGTSGPCEELRALMGRAAVRCRTEDGAGDFRGDGGGVVHIGENHGAN